MFYKTNPNSIFLYTCIHVYLHTCFLRNEPNSPFLNPCILASLYFYFSPNEANFKTTYLYNLCNLWFHFMQNKANFKVAQASVLEGKSASAPANSILLPFSLYHFTFLPNEPNSPFLNPCIPASRYSYFSPNEPNFKTTYLCNLRNLWFQFSQPVENRRNYGTLSRFNMR